MNDDTPMDMDYNSLREERRNLLARVAELDGAVRKIQDIVNDGSLHDATVRVRVYNVVSAALLGGVTR